MACDGIVTKILPKDSFKTTPPLCSAEPRAFSFKNQEYYEKERRAMSIENKAFRQAHITKPEKPRFPGIRQIKLKQPHQEGKKPGGEIKDCYI